MASIYKPTLKDPKTGKRVKCRYYRIVFIDENGKRRSVRGFKDKEATEAAARRIEQRVERIKAGLPVDDQTARPWAECVEAYVAELQRRGSQANGSHVRENRRQLTRLAADLAWSTPRDARASSLTEWLAARAVEGMAPRTQNHYATRVKAFLNWCVEQGWVAENPLARVKLAKVGQKGRRRLRRAYSAEELQALFSIVPEPRRTVYRIATLCGLRRKELKLLQKEDLTPIGPAPCWHLRPSIDKAGRGERIPMLPDCADLVRPLWEAAKPGERIFPTGKGRPGIATHLTLNADLAAAGIPKVDARGRHADFHSFRYTFCSLMGRVLPIQKVKVLMRHSTIKLTADLYTDLGIDDLAEGVWTLPRLNMEQNAERALQQAHTSAQNPLP